MRNSVGFFYLHRATATCLYTIQVMQLMVDTSVGSGFVHSQKTLGVLNLSVLVDLTGQLVSRACQFLRDFHMLPLYM